MKMLAVRKAPCNGQLLSTAAAKCPHIPVLLEPLTKFLQENLTAKSLIIDATFGAGGYSKRCLELGHRIIAMDQDHNAAAIASQIMNPNFRFVRSNFSTMSSTLGHLGVKSPDAILFDIGFSSMQVDDPERGFSFLRDGPLDMRMDQNQPLTAADIVNWYSETDLGKILLEFGEELNAEVIARAIVTQRKKTPFKRTGQIASLVKEINFPSRSKSSHPATRTFQALRISVNNEIHNLSLGLSQAVSLVRDGGILAVTTFHSIEDKIVKDIFKQHGLKNLITSSTNDEIKTNRRARSAKLRLAIR